MKGAEERPGALAGEPRSRKQTAKLAHPVCERRGGCVRALGGGDGGGGGRLKLGEGESLELGSDRVHSDAGGQGSEDT